jgi:hypothetical protein
MPSAWTGPQHYRQAEQFLYTAARAYRDGSDREPVYLAYAHVHALLALAAATGLNEAVAGMPLPDRDAWQHTAGTPLLSEEGPPP